MQLSRLHRNYFHFFISVMVVVLLIGACSNQNSGSSTASAPDNFKMQSLPESRFKKLPFGAQEMIIRDLIDSHAVKSAHLPERPWTVQIYPPSRDRVNYPVRINFAGKQGNNCLVEGEVRDMELTDLPPVLGEHCRHYTLKAMFMKNSEALYLRLTKGETSQLYYYAEILLATETMRSSQDCDNNAPVCMRMNKWIDWPFLMRLVNLGNRGRGLESTLSPDAPHSHYQRNRH